MTGIRPVRATLTALALAAAAATAHAAEAPPPGPLPGIHGTDDRVTVRPLDWPWTAIGRLERLSGGFCTATLVDPRHVLTAAHCIWDPQTASLRPPEDLRFAAAFYEGTAVALVPAAGYRLSPDYAPERGRSPEEAVRDWALVELAHPIDGILPIPVVAAAPGELEDAAADGRLTQAGYSQDRGEVLSVHAGCGVDRTVADGRLIMHLCDAVSGASGSPLLVFDEPEPGREGGIRLTGIHIGSAAADADTDTDTGAGGGGEAVAIRGVDGLGIAVTATAFAGWLTEALAGLHDEPALSTERDRPAGQRASDARASAPAVTVPMIGSDPARPTSR
ncbi:MAG: trypsin-like peptidase domain-containing protein [Azospirillaceae bacterium]